MWYPTQLQGQISGSNLAQGQISGIRPIPKADIRIRPSRKARYLVYGIAPRPVVRHPTQPQGQISGIRPRPKDRFLVSDLAPRPDIWIRLSPQAQISGIRPIPEADIRIRPSPKARYPVYGLTPMLDIRYPTQPQSQIPVSGLVQGPDVLYVCYQYVRRRENSFQIFQLLDVILMLEFVLYMLEMRKNVIRGFTTRIVHKLLCELNSYWSECYTSVCNLDGYMV